MAAIGTWCDLWIALLVLQHSGCCVCQRVKMRSLRCGRWIRQPLQQQQRLQVLKIQQGPADGSSSMDIIAVYGARRIDFMMFVIAAPGSWWHLAAAAATVPCCMQCAVKAPVLLCVTVQPAQH
jgi:hypothetical protein